MRDRQVGLQRLSVSHREHARPRGDSYAGRLLDALDDVANAIVIMDEHDEPDGVALEKAIDGNQHCGATGSPRSPDAGAAKDSRPLAHPCPTTRA